MGHKSKWPQKKRVKIALTPSNIHAMRQLFEMSQPELATVLGVNRSTVAKWESDYMTPNTLRQQQLEALFELLARRPWWDQLIDARRLAPPVVPKKQTISNVYQRLAENINGKGK